MPDSDPVAMVIESYCGRTVSSAAERFAKEVTALACAQSVNRAKAFLFATSRLGAFCESVGLELDPAVALHPSVIERCCAPGLTTMSAPTRRTVRSNLRAIARRLSSSPPPILLSRERAKLPYRDGEIASYLALADAQPTEARRMRTQALICLGAGAGLVGCDLKGVQGDDVIRRSGGVVVHVRAGRRPRTVPVLTRFHDRLLQSASVAGKGFLIGGTSPERRNVMTPLTTSLAGGADLPRIDISRLRSTWLFEVAGAIGLRVFMDAAGITCSQRLGDLVAQLPTPCEREMVKLLERRQ